jgi:BMFP domain-containing protein YqiC
MAQERVILLATARAKADEVAQRVSALEGELVAMHRTRDTAKENYPSLSAKAAAAE